MFSLSLRNVFSRNPPNPSPTLTHTVISIGSCETRFPRSESQLLQSVIYNTQSAIRSASVWFLEPWLAAARIAVTTGTIPGHAPTAGSRSSGFDWLMGWSVRVLVWAISATTPGRPLVIIRTAFPVTIRSLPERLQSTALWKFNFWKKLESPLILFLF